MQIVRRIETTDGKLFTHKKEAVKHVMETSAERYDEILKRFFKKWNEDNSSKIVHRAAQVALCEYLVHQFTAIESTSKFTKENYTLDESDY